MENIIIHKAATRGHANHGWLDSHHTFSFASYHNPERMHFGVLRVLNDDIVTGGMGFGTHPHENMEIISIPLSGDLEHKDSMNNVQVIKENDVQVMSAGTGIYHSEYNRNPDKPVNFLQIWIFPDKKNVTPRYDQKTFNPGDRINKLQPLIAPGKSTDTVWIHQQAWFYRGKFENNFETTYKLHNSVNGVYIFVLDGTLTINGNELDKRDGIGITGSSEVKIKGSGELLLMEVPMN
jgi:redox-sensitive bicupin YhaK (pirin superfamily)